MRRAPVRAWAALVGVVVLTAALGACTQEPDRLEPGSAERQIAEAVAEIVSPPVIEVRCPEQIPIEVDRRVECDVILGEPSGTLPVVAVQRDAAGTLEVLPQRAVLSDREVAANLRGALREKFGRSFQVDCGRAAATVREPGEQLICRARDVMSRRSVVATVEDERGTLSFEIVDP